MRKENSTNAINEKYLHNICALNVAIDAIGSRWIAQIVYSISKGFNRFHLLNEELPNISEQVLSRKLNRLEAQNILNKDVLPNTIPIGIQYTLTSKGEDLIPILKRLCEWERSHG